MLAILNLLLPSIGSVLDRLIPDVNARAQAQDEIRKALIEQESAVNQAIAEAAKAQAEVNLAEAQNPSMFVAGWRPFVGWVCGIACAYAFLIQPMLTWISVGLGGKPLPTLDSSVLMTVLGGMLGLGAMRTVEKTQGVDRSNMQQTATKKWK
jgi:hypothetical protein